MGSWQGSCVLGSSSLSDGNRTGPQSASSGYPMLGCTSHNFAAFLGFLEVMLDSVQKRM